MEQEVRRRILVFASGDEKGGGSGFVELVENSRTGVLPAEIIAVVSQHENGGVAKKAKVLGVPFELFKGPNIAATYQEIWSRYGEPWVALSGWIKRVLGLPARSVFNIHPAPLPGFGGKDWYGHRVHEQVLAAFRSGKITSSAVCMHFATDVYDDPRALFFKYPVLIRQDDDADSLGKRVNKIEHGWQSFITGLVVKRQIRYMVGAVCVPDWYLKMPFCPDNCRAY